MGKLCPFIMEIKTCVMPNLNAKSLCIFNKAKLLFLLTKKTNKAATKIQANFRGYRVRKQLLIVKASFPAIFW